MRRPLTLLVLLLLALPARAQDLLPDYERWYAVTIAGRRAGWMSTAQATAGDRVTTSSALSLRVGRGATTVSISMNGAFTESKDGQPVSMSTTQRLGQAPISTTSEFKDGQIVTTTTTEGRTDTATRPQPEGQWLTPARAAAAARQALRDGKPEFSLRTIDPLASPEPVVLTRKGLAKQTVTLAGRPVEVYRVESTSSIAPFVTSTEELDADGLPVRFSTRLGPLELQFEQTTREAAQTPATGNAPEILVATMVRPNRPIADARQTRRAVYVLSVPDGAFPEVPSTGTQAAERLDDRRVRIRVDSTARVPAEGTNPALLAATPLADARDPAVIDLAQRAVGATDLELAQALRRLARGHIERKDLDAAFASASETVRQRRGDCTEHAVLLCAMLRARGIPARVVSGLVYADQFAGQRDAFAYHMWTQALVESGGVKAWVDLDAALGGVPQDAPVTDAARIALATWTLAPGEEITAMGALAAVLGRLEITVEEVR